jgi:hypothetical protein
MWPTLMMRSRRFAFRAGVAPVLALALAPGCAVAALSEGRLPRFHRVVDQAPGDAATALAVAPDGRVAIGGTRGVRWATSEGMPEAVLRRGPVTDLAFIDDGILLVATAEGLYRVDRDGKAVREHIAPGSDTPVRRLDGARGVAVAATDSGVYVREPAGRWRPVQGLPRRGASLAALRARPGDLALWAVIEGELWIADASPAGHLADARVSHRSLPMAHRSEPAQDVHFGLPGADAVLVFPDSLAVRRDDGLWRTLRPSLPPGSRARRIALAHGRLWLATDAGLLSSERLEGPWERAESPLGTSPIFAMEGGASAIWVAARGRVLVSVPAQMDASPLTDAPPPSRGVSDEPAIGEVQRAALSYVDLQPERMRALRDGAETRGWLPVVHVTGAYDRGRAHRRDRDESFVSGEMRSFSDRQRDEDREIDVALTLSWDLGDAVFHPEEIDVSREARAVIALRDDVLDEVTQLYFERRRVLADLARVGADAPESSPLAVRAAELRAGLDAWTGGWFSRRTRPIRPGDHLHGPPTGD